LVVLRNFGDIDNAVTKYYHWVASVYFGGDVKLLSEDGMCDVGDIGKSDNIGGKSRAEAYGNTASNFAVHNAIGKENASSVFGDSDTTNKINGGGGEESKSVLVFGSVENVYTVGGDCLRESF